MRRSSPVRSLLAAGVSALAALLLLPATRAGAQTSEPAAALVPLEVIVVHTSNREGGVDPRARELDAQLRQQLRYQSLRVLSEQRIELRLDQVGTIRLPDGRAVRVRPMHRDDKGVLLAVDVEGAVKLDARAANHHKVVIGAGEYEDGHLAVSIEPDFAD